MEAFHREGSGESAWLVVLGEMNQTILCQQSLVAKPPATAPGEGSFTVLQVNTARLGLKGLFFSSQSLVSLAVCGEKIFTALERL